MLENPYYTAQPDIPYDAGVYRGEGRIEESPDGSSIVVRWESPLDEGVAAQWELQRKLGSLKAIRKAQIVYAVVAVCCLLLVAIFRFNIEFYTWLVGFFGIFMFAMIFLKPLLFRIAVRKLVVNLRGSIGSVDSLLTVDAAGVHQEAQDMVWTFRWRSVADVEVSKTAVAFVRQPAGLMHVPVRVFPDVATLERFVALALKYQKQRPA